MVKMVLVNGPKQYLIGDLVAKSAHSNFYICDYNNSKYFLQIAASIEQSFKLNSAAYILKQLKLVSDIYESKFRVRFPDEQLNYDWLFPTVMDSFVPSGQGGRIANVLAINNGDSLDKMVPLSNIRKKDRRITDLATSVWIAGRLLKLLVLAHDQCVSLVIDSDNVIIEPKNHNVVVLDWTNATIHQNEMSDEVRMSDIASVALVTLSAIGEDVGDSERYPGNIYVDFLKGLVKDRRSDIKQVYADFEMTHGQLFEKGTFYPFATFSI